MTATVASSGAAPRWVRAAELALTLALLLLAAPLMLLLAVWLGAGGGGVWFGQQRLGRGGTPFRLWKFRTLAGDGPDVVPGNDPRHRRLGRWLRRTRLDELPQLWNVLCGDMALVGPRPEVPGNLAAVPADELARVLAVRPGLTGPTQLAFVAEDEVLAMVLDPVVAYRQVLVPAKVRRDLLWLAGRCWAGDLLVLLRTPLALLSPAGYRRSRATVQALLAGAGRSLAAALPDARSVP
jgi:lipopolysaccharide/colanic/teichoic acid biosynthesis glycosyltransferase